MRWLLTRGRLPFLCALAVATAWLGVHAVHIPIESSNRSLDSRDPEEVTAQERFRAIFGGDDDILVAVEGARVLEPGGLARIASLADRIARIEGVRRVYALSNAQQIVASEDGAELASLAGATADDPAALRAALDRNPDLTGLLVSADRKTAGLLIEVREGVGAAHLIDSLRALQAQVAREGLALHVTGVLVQKHDVSAYIARDQRVLMPLAVGALAIALGVFFSFRSVVGIALPLAVTGVTTAATLGLYGLLGLQLNAITSLLPPVLMVLSLAVSVHLIQGWIDARGDDRVARVLGVVRHLRFPCFFCALTTALGFASLVTSGTPAVQQFGIFAAIGVLVSFAVGMTLVPVGLTFLAPPSAPLAAPQHRLLRGLLARAAELAAEHPVRVLAVTGALTLVGLAGLPRVRNNTDLVGFLRSGAPLRRDTRFVDEHLTGPETLDFVVARRDGAPLTTRDAVQRMAAFERAARAHGPVTGVSSIVGVLRQITRAETGGTALALPADDRDTAYAFDLLDAAPDQDLLRKLVAPDFTAARFDVRLHPVGTAVAAPLADALLAEARTIFGDAYRVDATGAFYRVARDSNRLVVAQVESFSLALVLVFVAIGVLFRSARLTGIALVPNLMPVIWTGGLMGYLGIDLSTGTAMIASAVIGLVVDDTIHYLTGFSRAYRGDPREAVRRTTNGIGTALVLNNVILVLGFWVGCFGSFKPTVYFSLLTGVTMLSALACDLLVTPACLVLFDRRPEPVPCG